jgi:hypothetical protein
LTLPSKHASATAILYGSITPVSHVQLPHSNQTVSKLAKYPVDVQPIGHGQPIAANAILAQLPSTPAAIAAVISSTQMA